MQATEPAPADVYVEIEIGAAKGELRLWRAREAMRQAELSLRSQTDARDNLRAAATSLLGWSVTALGAVVAAALSASHAAWQGAALVAIATLLITATLCVAALFPRSWARQGYDPDQILDSRYESELEILESLALGGSRDMRDNRLRLIRLSRLVWSAWVTFAATPPASAAALRLWDSGLGGLLSPLLVSSGTRTGSGIGGGAAFMTASHGAAGRILQAATGVVTGLVAEARVARPLGQVATGTGSANATVAAERLVADGARALLSFGLAGGLEPKLRPGALLVPKAVIYRDATVPVDVALRLSLGEGITCPLLATDKPIAGAGYKALLHRMTGAVAVDMESGAVAQVAVRHGLPFAVLRAVCDPAERTLSPTALLGLDAQGGMVIGRVLAALLRQPGELPTLLTLGRDAATARRSLIRRVDEIRLRGGLML